MSVKDARVLLSKQIGESKWGEGTRGRLVTVNTIHDKATKNYKLKISNIFKEAGQARTILSGVTFFYVEQLNSSQAQKSTIPADPEGDFCTIEAPTTDFTCHWSFKGKAWRSIQNTYLANFQLLVSNTCGGNKPSALLKEAMETTGINLSQLLSYPQVA